MSVCEAVDSRQASLLSFSSLPKREAKGGKAAAFNRGAEERWKQRAQIKQMPESGLESQPVVIRFEWERTAAGITHLGLSTGRPHRYTPSQHSARLEVHAHRGASSCARPMSFWYASVYVSTYNLLLQLFFKSSTQTLALTWTWNLPSCAVSLQNNKSQVPLKHWHVRHLRKTSSSLFLHGGGVIICVYTVFFVLKFNCSSRKSNLQTTAGQVCEDFKNILLLQVSQSHPLCCHLHPATHGMCFATVHKDACTCGLTEALPQKQGGGGMFDCTHVHIDLEYIEVVMLHLLLN